jgi:putative glutamine amidotransferase
MQVLNVALGGTLWQDIKRQVDGALEHNHEQRNSVVHPIDVEPASRLRDITRAPSVAVNSVHHQALREVAVGLQVTGVAPDGLVEAVEHRNHAFAVGVQCHPEELDGRHAWASLLFREFVASARA